VSHPVARRYAQAYFELAEEAGAIQAWRADLSRAVATVSGDAVERALTNPRLRRAQRERSAGELLDGVSEPARNLMRLLISRGRLRLAPTVLAEFDRLADADAGVVRAEVTTAVHVDDATKTGIISRIRRRLGESVQVEVRQDPSIMGGLVIRIGDRVIDNSVRTHLQQLHAAVAG